MRDREITWSSGRKTAVSALTDEELCWAIDDVAGSPTPAGASTTREWMLERLRIEQLIRKKGWR
ncbi:MAG: hypothetical protein WDM81_13835 [Rhizomicrobium sp.]